MASIRCITPRGTTGDLTDDAERGKPCLVFGGESFGPADLTADGRRAAWHLFPVDGWSHEASRLLAAWNARMLPYLDDLAGLDTMPKSPEWRAAYALYLYDDASR